MRSHYPLQKKLFLLFFWLIAFSHAAIAQELSEQDQETFNQGVFHFEREDYQIGLTYFRELIHKYPRDPVFNYFSGVSMTELMIDLETAIRQLNLASVGKVPNNVYYYLGKAHHLRGEFTEAVSNYRHFVEVGEREEIRELETEKMIGFCHNKVTPKEWENRQNGERVEFVTQKKESLSEEQFDGTPKAYDLLVAEVHTLQSKADSTSTLADQKRIALRLIHDETEKSSLEKEILVLEKQTYDFMQQAKAKNQEIRELEDRMVKDQIASDPDAFRPVDRGSGFNLSDEMNLDPGSMMGRQLNDEDYLKALINDILPDRSDPALENLIRINSGAIQTMKNARVVEHKMNQEVLAANSAKNRRDVSRANENIKTMKEEALRLKYDAIIQYQQVNDQLFVLFDNEINRISVQPEEAQQAEVAIAYRNQALQAYNKAREIRDEAKTSLDQEKKYDLVAEANAYELVALENQKRAYATLTGILPLPETYARETEKAIMENEIMEDDLVVDQEREQDEGSEEERESFDASRYTGVEEKAGFEVRSGSPYSDENPVPVDRILPDGVIYRIQVGVFSHRVRNDFFRTLYPVTAETDLEANFIRYYAGFFKKYAEAESALPRIQKEGYHDAFIVAHWRGEKVTLDRAKDLQQAEQENRNAVAGSGTSHTAENPLFRIQFGIFNFQLTERNLKVYRDKIGKYKIQYLRNIEGEYIYTIGIFRTFEEAERVREILVSNGLGELETIAFVGNKRIPLK